MYIKIVLKLCEYNYAQTNLALVLGDQFSMHQFRHLKCSTLRLSKCTSTTIQCRSSWIYTFFHSSLRLNLSFILGLSLTNSLIGFCFRVGSWRRTPGAPDESTGGQVGMGRIWGRVLDRALDNSDRRQYGMGVVGRFFG